MKTTIEHKYEITDVVYHITPESPKGIINDWKYSRSANEIIYLVSIGFGQEFWCYEHELKTERRKNQARECIGNHKPRTMIKHL